MGLLNPEKPKRPTTRQIRDVAATFGDRDISTISADEIVSAFGPISPNPNVGNPNNQPTPYSMEEFSRDLNSGNITSQEQLNARIATRGWSGNTVADVGRSSALSAPSTPTSGGSSNPSSPLGGGSDGSNFGSVGAGWNPAGGTRFDSAGNVIIGTTGSGRNIIRGATAVDRSAGVNNDPMSSWAQFTDPNYFMGRSEDIRKQVERQMQGTIDAINRQYEGQVRREEEAGAQDMARMRSMNLRAGLGGSTFGAANKAEVRTRTNQNIADIQANQDVAVSNAMTKIEEIANQRIQMEQTAMQNAFTNTIAMKGLQIQMQTQAKENIKELGAAGLDMATIKKRDPALYQSITSAAGIGEVQAEYLMNAAKRTAEKVDYTWQVVGNKVLGYGVDPRTGELKQVSQDLAVEVPKNYGVSFAPDGTMIMVPDQFDPNIPPEQQIKIGSNYAKPESSGGYNNTMLDNERALMSSFKSEPIVKNYNEVANKAETVSAIINGGMGGPGDLAVVFEFMKALDPTSVVREAEYEAASKSGNIFAGTWTRFNKGYFDPQGGILPEQVKQDFVKAINVKMAVAQKQYDNLANEYSSVATRQGLDPRNVVIGYGNAFNPETPSDPESQAAVAAPVGSIVYLNGKPYKKLGDDNYQELSSISAPK